MPESTTSFLFPDVNVWIALTYERHVHHVIASDWLSDLREDSRLLFCRFTQLGLLRLLTAEAVMGDEVLSQREAWTIYDRWLQDDRVEFLDDAFRGVDKLGRRGPAARSNGITTPTVGRRQLASEL